MMDVSVGFGFIMVQTITKQILMHIIGWTDLIVGSNGLLHVGRRYVTRTW